MIANDLGATNELLGRILETLEKSLGEQRAGYCQRAELQEKLLARLDKSLVELRFGHAQRSALIELMRPAPAPAAATKPEVPEAKPEPEPGDDKPSEVLAGLRRRAMENYRAALSDCQIPTGPLAFLTPADFYTWTLERRLAEDRSAFERRLRNLRK